VRIKLDVASSRAYADAGLLADLAAKAEPGWDGFFVWDFLLGLGKGGLASVTRSGREQAHVGLMGRLRGPTGSPQVRRYGVICLRRNEQRVLFCAEISCFSW
jgi:hypothetical protein